MSSYPWASTDPIHATDRLPLPMDNVLENNPSLPHTPDAPVVIAPQRQPDLAALLEGLDESVRAVSPARARHEADNQNALVQVRLGIAASLFAALRAKHAPTASHSLRVALGCSSWALAAEVSTQQRDAIEVAALLHDIGKIGVSDEVLLKPSRLSAEEFAAVEMHRQNGLEILRGCCASQDILDIVHYAAAWFDGGRMGFDRSGEKLPLGSRILSVVDAFDSMTTDHVYRRAMSRERAVAELYECAGTQFDPVLVHQFGALLAADQVRLHAGLSRRWLEELDVESSNGLWSAGWSAAPSGSLSVERMFYKRLTDSMYDAVVFVDNGRRILLWNRAAERLTGIPGPGVHQKQWSPALVELRDEDEATVTDAECPVLYAMRCGVHTVRRMSLAGRGGQRLAVDVYATPVVGSDGAVYGAVLLLHDASARITLEERVQSLHEKATRDPLTHVSNRAEFDRVFQQCVVAHLEQHLPCSLIMCDLDHFKRINDTCGHQAGDGALVSFAALLCRHCRKGDLVARYGGEEFVLLCADCDNATATERAEAIRRELADTPQPALGGKCITASFGVTEVQGGDTPETMLRRADRALLQAKDLGRNTVVQLGSGISETHESRAGSGWLSWFRPAPFGALLERELTTPVPLNVAAEKLRGFVADQHAEITSIDENHVTLKLDGHLTPFGRRRADRPVSFRVELRFAESRDEPEGQSRGTPLRTLVHVAIGPARNRDRRTGNVVGQARQLLYSLQAYLMAQEQLSTASKGREEKPAAGDRVIDKARTIFAPFFRRQR